MTGPEYGVLTFESIPAAIATVYVSWAANKVRKQQIVDHRELDRRKVDAEAYDRARGIYEGLVNELEGQLKTLRGQSHETQVEYDKLQKELWREQNSVYALHKQIASLESKLQSMEFQIGQMEDTISSLRRRLTAAGIDTN